MNVPMNWNTLVEVATLAAHLRDERVCVLDCRADLLAPTSAARAYAEGHVPGAHHADLESDFSAMDKIGQGRHPWPEATDFSRRLAAWGIRPDTQVVLYDAGNGMYAARGWWLLQTFGHVRAAVLDGGLAAWCEAGLPLTREVPPRLDGGLPYPGDFDHSRLFDHEDVIAHLAHGGLLLDARAVERFRGEVEPMDWRAGHVPGAVNRPFAENLAKNGHFKSAAELFVEFAGLLAGRTPSDMVVMCGSGVTACHHLLAMAHAGLQGGKLYKGSWSGWISDPARPVALSCEE